MRPKILAITRNLFVAGLLILVPIIGTIWILDILLSIVDSIFYDILIYLEINSIWIRLLITALIVFLLGIIAKTGIGRYVFNKLSSTLNRIPIIKKVYGFTKDTTELIFEKKSFSTVVKVEFPLQGVYSLGFLTNTVNNSIFIPTTPNPTNGFYIMTENYEILDMSVEDAIKQIMSMGAVATKTFIGGGK